jgi:hypothetical protein
MSKEEIYECNYCKIRLLVYLLFKGIIFYYVLINEPKYMIRYGKISKTIMNLTTFTVHHK